MTLGRRRMLALAGGGLVGVAGCIDASNTLAEDPSNGDDGSNSDDGDNGDGGSDGIRWEYDTPGSVSAIHDGILYGREDFQGGSGGVVALNASTGDSEWTYGETGGYTMFTSPVVADAVYFGWGDDAIGSGSGRLHAVEHDGTERWTGDTGSVYDQPILYEGMVFAGSDDGSVYAFDAESGEEAWSVPLEAEEVPPDPSVELVADGVAYVTVEGTIRALDVTDGDERWSYRATERRVVGLERAGGIVYFATSATDDAVGALANGEEQWTVDLDGLKRLSGVDHGTVYVRQRDELHALDVEDGSERWHEGAADAVAVHDDGVYAGAVELRSITPDGETEWSTPLDGSELQSISPADEEIYAITEEGVYRLDRAGETTASVTIEGVGSHVVGDGVYVGSSEGVFALEL